jgi:predicted DNA-binding transcriptional regulator AlpA
MSEPENSRKQSSDEKLYTLSEVSKLSGISMPTLQRYKKLYQDRIPSRGKGRKQRYPHNALPVFDQIKHENAGRRGRPRKNAEPVRAAATRGGARAAKRPRLSERQTSSGRGPAPATGRGGRAQVSGRRGTPGNLLTLTQISKSTGISYPTLVRYVRLYSDRLPHEGKGRARRFYPQAVDVFRQLRQESGRGGRKKGSTAPPRGRVGRPPGSGRDDSGVAQRLRSIEKSQQDMERRFRGFVQSLQKLLK